MTDETKAPKQAISIAPTFLYGDIGNVTPEMIVTAEKMALAASVVQGSFDHAEAVTELARRLRPLVVYENDPALDANLAEQPET